LQIFRDPKADGVCFFGAHDFDIITNLKDFAFFICKRNQNTTKNTRIDYMSTEPKTISVKLPAELAARSEALKEKTGISEASIIRQAITAGIGKVEEAFDLLHEEIDPADQAVS
jgi:predicted DNA-binding protein